MLIEKFIASLIEGNEPVVAETVADLHKKLKNYLMFRFQIAENDADDAVQETMLLLFERSKNNNLKQPRNPAAYVYTVLRHECFKLLRASSQVCDPDESYLTQVAEPNQLTDINLEEYQRIIAECMGCLSEFNYNFLSFTVEHPEKSSEEIATHFGIKSSNISIRKFRLRKFVYNCVERRYRIFSDK